MKSKFPEINNEDRFMYRQPSTVDCTVAMFQIEGERTKYFKCTSKRRVIIFESYFALLYPGRMVKRQARLLSSKKEKAEIVRQRKINGELEKIIRENDDELKSIHGKLKSSLDETDSLKVDVQRVLKLLATFHEERHMESNATDQRISEKNVELTNLQELLMQKEIEFQSVGERVKSFQCELENSNKESVSKSQQLELLQQQFDAERERTQNAVISEREYINQIQDLRSQITIKKAEVQSKCNIISAQKTLLDINTRDLNAAKNSYNQLKEEISRLEVGKLNLSEQLACLLVENPNE
ncbi:unnamed protein product [Orchesella dallaii]|uniref:Uncharacterized protein n=1 Tax=Orchesella dallaii TaxID=48710 RepID=A0ABP1R7K3_9HEXA